MVWIGSFLFYPLSDSQKNQPPIKLYFKYKFT